MAGRPRERGSTEQLPSGAVRVRLYAGVDPVTKKPHYLREVVPSGPKQAREVRKAKVRLAAQVEERRNPRTNATVKQLLDRYLRRFDGAPTTKAAYVSYVRNHIAPFIGKVKVGELDADILDSLYVELRRCRDHCTGPFQQHRTAREHDCDERCRPHVCTPLGPSAVRHIHFLLSGAYKRAVRWRWVAVNPVQQAEAPAMPAPKPQPPTPAQAARILTDAWQDPDWGTFVWLAMTTGARRGELCALRWADIDLDSDRPVVWLRRAIREGESGWVEGETKTHQQRRVALDAETAVVLAEHRDRWRDRVSPLGATLGPDSFVFSPAPDASVSFAPPSMSQRYERQVKRLGIETTLHKLRHYSATELIMAGVDVRTVAGRLGHGGGGVTTLRTYTAWVSESDQRAAVGLAQHMPRRPAPLTSAERVQRNPRSPYEKIAVEIRRQVRDGELAVGAPVPALKELAAEHGVAMSTAQRAVELLAAWGDVERRAGRSAVVRRPQTTNGDGTEQAMRPVHEAGESLDLEVLHLGEVVRKFRAEADPDSTAELRQLLTDAVKRLGGSEAELGEYEMNVRYAGERGLITTFVASARG